jgi:putative membrane protein
VSGGGATKDRPGGARPTLAGRNAEDVAFLLSSRRTRLSFQRTRMSTDRTLMSIVRTALSLIGFGFTIFQFFRGLHEAVATRQAVGAMAGRNFGTALVGLGLLILTLGIGGHVHFMLDLRREHDALVEEGLIPHDRLPYSVTLAVALLLWLLGLIAIISMVTRLGPLG